MGIYYTKVSPLDVRRNAGQLLLWAEEGRLWVVVRDSKDEEREKLMEKAVRVSMQCRPFLAKGRTEEDVRIHFGRAFGTFPEECMKRMRMSSKVRRFIAQNVGVMFRDSVFRGKVMELAIALRFTSQERNSLKKRIYEGMQFEEGQFF